MTCIFESCKTGACLHDLCIEFSMWQAIRFGGGQQEGGFAQRRETQKIYSTAPDISPRSRDREKRSPVSRFSQRNILGT
jgi:hypothetical protein